MLHVMASYIDFYYGVFFETFYYSIARIKSITNFSNNPIVDRVESFV